VVGWVHDAGQPGWKLILCRNRRTGGRHGPPLKGIEKRLLDKAEAWALEEQPFQPARAEQCDYSQAHQFYEYSAIPSSNRSMYSKKAARLNITGFIFI
jgi:hypothetical protein